MRNKVYPTINTPPTIMMPPTNSYSKSTSLPSLPLPHFGLALAANQAETDVTPPAIPITLTSMKDESHRRHLNLIAGQPCIIGRASRSREKNMEASPDNALFDCPVISRKHAKLLAHPWAAADDQVQLVDADSIARHKGERHQVEPWQGMELA